MNFNVPAINASALLHPHSRCRFAVAVIAISLLLQASAIAQDDWARWRGPEGNGVAAKDQKPPVTWTESDFLWKVKVPGKGHASPTIVGDQIFLETADVEQGTQSVVCYDRKTGDEQWKTTLNEGGFQPKIHPSNTYASQTIATDRKSLFAVFSHHDKVELYCLSFSGEKLWSKVVGDYNPRFKFGYGTSPIVYEDKVIVSNENQTDGGLYAFNTETSEPVWKIDRGTNTSWSVPVVATVGGEKQLLISGGKSVSSYNPEDGKSIWTTPAIWEVTCGTMVWEDDLVFASGGWPDQQTLAIDSKTSMVVWSNPIKCYEQSMLVVDGYVYGVDENGIAHCWRAEDGQETWKGRIGKGKFKTSASPVLANGHIYIPGENGKVVVLKTNSEAMEKVATNELGTAVFASFAVCGNQIFARYSQGAEEFLVCIGKK